MTWFPVLAVILVVVVALILAAKVKSGAGLDEGSWPFYAKKPLSAPEQVLYFRLGKSLPDHIVLAQVGLSRLLGVKKAMVLRHG